ncbi:MAG: chorismate mutase [Lachnospiraceae bacterium]|nr:chorismate mutase [Lachnospiraceae bacterium]
MNKMDELRTEIENIDTQMAALFEKRMGISAQVAEFKKEHGLPVLDKEREKILIAKNTAKLNNKELEVYYRDFFENMLNISKSYQHKLLEGVKVAYSGIEGSFASISAGKILPDAQRIPYGSFNEAYNAVCNGECDFAVLPIENSYAGEVGAVTDLMFKGELYVTGVYELGVSQCLLGVKNATLESIKNVISHPQALDQCNEYIKRHDLKTITADNTAIAAKEVADKNDVTTAAIASKEAAAIYGLTILDYDINESAQNTTRFAVFSRNSEVLKDNDAFSTFILMFTVKNEAGSLADAIAILGKHGYNMRVIRSRPSKNENWQYYFYTEVEGKIACEEGNAMLEDLKKECNMLKVIGTYRPDVKI